jgi:hypothetical protein
MTTLGGFLLIVGLLVAFVVAVPVAVQAFAIGSVGLILLGPLFDLRGRL